MLTEKIIETHEAHPEKGYREIRDDLERYQGIHVNDKRVLRICRAMQKVSIPPSSTGSQVAPKQIRIHNILQTIY